jgi:hypothetical protein
MLSDRELLAIMSALIVGANKATKEPTAEFIVDVAEEILEEVNERCNKRGGLLPDDDRE